MIIDAHTHIRWLDGDEDFSRSVKNYRPMLEYARLAGIDKLCAMGYQSHNFVMENSFMLKLMELFPEKLYGLCLLDPRKPALCRDEMKRCLEDNPLSGIKLWISARATDPLLDPIAEKAAELQVILLQHAFYKTTGNLPFESTPADVAELARRYPELIIQMAHLGGARARGLHEIAPYPNIYVDTAGGEAAVGWVEQAVEILGPERVIYGSDAHMRSFGVQLAKITAAEIPDSAKELILSKNFLSLLAKRR